MHIFGTEVEKNKSYISCTPMVVTEYLKYLHKLVKLALKRVKVIFRTQKQ